MPIKNLNKIKIYKMGKLKTKIGVLFVGIVIIGVTVSLVSALTISSPTTSGLNFLGDRQLSVSTDQGTAYATFKLYDAPDTTGNDYYVIWMQATGQPKEKACWIGGDGNIREVQPKVTLVRSDEYVTDWTPAATVDVSRCSTTTLGLDVSGRGTSAGISQTFATCGDKITPYVDSKYFYPKWTGNEERSVASIGGVEFKTAKNKGYDVILSLRLATSCF